MYAVSNKPTNLIFLLMYNTALAILDLDKYIKAYEFGLISKRVYLYYCFWYKDYIVKIKSHDVKFTKYVGIDFSRGIFVFSILKREK